MKIIDVNFDKLNRVVHLADIHIRLFIRQAEYKRSFRKLYRELKQLDLDQYLEEFLGHHTSCTHQMES